MHNSYTTLNNLDYYFAAGTGNTTGNIITDPISSGICPPCEPPLITQIGADPVPYCGAGVNLDVEASGTLPDYAWYRPDSTLLSWQPEVNAQYEPAGQYTVVVSNACGADTAQIDAILDTGHCVPVTIDSAWFTPWNWGIYSGIQLHSASTGSCPQYEWTMPWGDTQPTDVLHQLNVPNPTEGNYTLVASNACGSDTLVLYVVPPEPCEGPVLGNASITAGNLCKTGPATFDVTVGGPGPMTTRWYGPGGQLITGTPNFTIPFASWGTYTFVAGNYCRTDTLTVFHGPVDTTGLAACQPPQLLSLSATPTACYRDTVDIMASVALAGPCATLAWSNVQILSNTGDHYQAVLTTADQVLLTATNGCGQVVAQVPVEVVIPQFVDRNLCHVTEVLSLDSLLAPYDLAFSGGQWKLDGFAHGGFYDPAVDSSGIYQYYLETNGGYCSVVDFGLHEFPGVFAGEDSSVTVCGTDPPFPLFSMLGGAPQTGGYWRYGSTPTSSTFDPAVNTPGTYTYRVQALGLGGGCTDMAQVNVSVNPASTWYADMDGDGLGDPADTLPTCTQPTGFVAMAGDECPEAFGTVGDTCDDGDPNTVNDVLRENCTCAGELGTGIAERSSSYSRLWPSPNDGHSFYLHMPMDYGVTTLTIIDATGRNLLQKNVAASLAPIKVDLPADMAPGTYIVSLVTDRGVETKRLVIAR